MYRRPASTSCRLSRALYFYASALVAAVTARRCLAAYRGLAFVARLDRPVVLLCATRDRRVGIALVEVDCGGVRSAGECAMASGCTGRHLLFSLLGAVYLTRLGRNVRAGHVALLSCVLRARAATKIWACPWAAVFGVFVALRRAHWPLGLALIVICAAGLAPLIGAIGSWRSTTCGCSAQA